MESFYYMNFKMKELLSLKWNIVKFDEYTSNIDISDIILNRFEEGKFEKNTSISMLHDPYSLKDMDRAVERIKKAKENNEKIMIFWDYDVDWVTSTSLLMHFFIKIWLTVSYRLPDRIKDWYWLKKYFIDELDKLGVNLIITVDCWTRDVEIVKYANEKNIDVIITDHHSVPEEIPEEAVALINPKRQDCYYENKNLCWAWVAYKLLQALSEEFLDSKEKEKYLQESIDIVALWTVADCMELTWENRIIVSEWLKQIKNSRSIWLRRLIEDKINEEIDADIFSFFLWPKLNAAWRMDSPYKAVNLILNNWDSVNRNIMEIEKLNEKRKYLTKQFYEDALNRVRLDDNIIFYISPAIDHWIIWIVAWKLSENFYKPVICLKDEWEKLVASCRSPEYYSIIDLLEKYKDYFVAFGWHKQAAGFTILKEKFIEFKSKIINDINKEDFSEKRKELKVDKIIKLNEIWFGLIKKIDEFKPYWKWNLRPIFMIKWLEYENIEFIWNWRDHIRFTNKHWFKILAFWMGEYYREIVSSRKNINIIFEINEDNWNWNKSIMLNVSDIVLS